MPIRCHYQLNPISQEEFYEVDYRIMELVFAIHNEFGRLYNEKIYQVELADRCIKIGLGSVLTEVPVEVSFQDFSKMYYLDLVINDSLIYELKTVIAITGDHQKQLINYLLLTGLNYGKIINFKTRSVKHRFVSTTLTPESRFDYEIDDSNWESLDEDSIWLKELISKLILEWGAFLDLQLFWDAIIYFRGGEGKVVRNIEIKNDSIVLGKQRVHLLNDKTSFIISAITGQVSHYESNLRKFIQHTSLQAIQWINMGHHWILFKTIKAE